MKGVVCDVGHTIITDSILNKILTEKGNGDAAVKLYDESILIEKSQIEIDQWVDKVSSYKLNCLRSLTVAEIERYCETASITNGLAQFVTDLKRINIPILFIGAVPSLITTLLLKVSGITKESHPNVYVDGSSIQVENDRVVKPVKICTPGMKKCLAEKWALSLGIKNEELVVIGDSIGDVPVMELTVKRNRYGVHVSSSILRSMIASEVKDFTEIMPIYSVALNEVVEEI